jgi:NADP-dependent 3-hydroxy acid dehydrogenase YdfG
MTNTQAPVAVITGGASGIGLATAELLADRGYRLVLADIEAGRLDTVSADLSAKTEVEGVVVDVREREALERLADVTYEHFGRTDLLFNNAGVALRAPVASLSHDDWHWIIDVDLWGPIHGVEAFLPRMLEAGEGGHVMFTSSFAGLAPNIGLGAYCVAKYGVVALAEVLHRELRDTDVHVSVLCPMLVETNIGSSARNRPEDVGGQAEPVDAVPPPRRDDEPPPGGVLPVDGVAQLVVDSIGTDRLYLVTHLDSRAMVQRRFERIDRAFAETERLG